MQFDEASSTLSIRGESYPENAFEFFKPIQQWVGERASKRDGVLVLEIAVTYMNTSSVKCMMDLIDQLDAASQRGANVSVRWVHSESDERIRELGEELLDAVTLPHTFVVRREDQP
ncbi:MAG: DUF1987 domain-containing protein [Myxococcales bacterium]|nr:DUF1987 domain-containing protein [Myxococcales bacterium]